MANVGKGSLVLGVILVCIGTLFLMRTWYGFYWLWSFLATWWPLLFIAFGTWRIVSYFRFSSRGTP